MEMEGGNGNGLLEQEECVLTINEGMSVGMYTSSGLQKVAECVELHCEEECETAQHCH